MTRRLRSMKVSDSFRDFVLDQISDIPRVTARAMFGGIGLYAGDVFFGILAADVLYFKVDDSNRPDYEGHGSRPFKPYDDRPMTMSYYNVPAGILENASELATWARRSISIARAAAAKARTKAR